MSSPPAGTKPTASATSNPRGSKPFTFLATKLSRYAYVSIRAKRIREGMISKSTPTPLWRGTRWLHLKTPEESWRSYFETKISSLDRTPFHLRNATVFFKTSIFRRHRLLRSPNFDPSHQPLLWLVSFVSRSLYHFVLVSRFLGFMIALGWSW